MNCFTRQQETVWFELWCKNRLRKCVRSVGENPGFVGEYDGVTAYAVQVGVKQIRIIPVKVGGKTPVTIKFSE